MADGSIIFDTKIDTSTFEKSLKKVISSNDELKVKVTADTTGLEKELNNPTSPINIMKGILGASITQKAVEGVVEFGKAAITTASDLQEVQNVVDVTFGDKADDINKWAANTAQSFGLTELQAKKYTGTIGAMVRSMGLSEEEAATMAINMAALAGDMASFYNLDHEAAFAKIRSGISGETEPLKQLGINMSVAALEAHAMSQGITTAYEDMTEAEKVNLRESMLMEKTAGAQGDFARTSEGFANQMRTLENNITTISAELGEKMLPFLSSALGLANGFLSGLATGGETQTPLQQEITAAADSLAAIGTEINSIKNNYAQTTITIDIEYNRSQELLDDYEAIAGIENKTDEQTLQMKEITEQLVAMYPQLAAYVGEDGLLTKEADQVQALIGDYAELAKQKAYTQMVSDIYAQYLTAGFEFDILGEKRDIAQSEIDSITKRLGQIEELREMFAAFNIGGAGGGTAWDNDWAAQAKAMQAYVDVFEGFDESTLAKLSEAGVDIQAFMDGMTVLTPEALANASPQEQVDALKNLRSALEVIGGDGAFDENSTAVTSLMSQLTDAQTALADADAALASGMTTVAEAQKEYDAALAAYEKAFGESGAEDAESFKDGVESKAGEINTSAGKMTADAAKEFIDEKAYYKAGQRNTQAYNKGAKSVALYTPDGSGGSGGSDEYRHATGLNFVPYDNYPARLHHGEAVLRASDAAAWRASKQSGGDGVSAAAVSAIVTKLASRPVVLTLDGHAVAEIMAAGNRAAIGSRNKSIALGVGQK